MNKTKVRTISKGQYGECDVGEIGYVDGYVRGADDAPYAVVVIGSRIVLLKTFEIEVLLPNTPSHE